MPLAPFCDSRDRTYLVDSGSEISLLPAGNSLGPPLSRPVLKAANGTTIPVYAVNVAVSVDLAVGRVYNFHFTVAAVPFAILGADFFARVRPHHRYTWRKAHRQFHASLNQRLQYDKPSSSSISHVYTAVDGEHFQYVRTTAAFKDLIATPLEFSAVSTPGVSHRIVTNGRPVHARTRRKIALSELSTDVRHISGNFNIVSDCLSRPPSSYDHNTTENISANVAGATMSQSGIDLKRLVSQQQTSKEVAELVESPSLSVEKRPIPGTTTELSVDVSTGIDRPLLRESLQSDVFHMLYDISHPSARATRRLISERFVFKGISSKVAALAKQCLHCQKSKITRHQRTPLIRPPLPTGRFESLNVDIVGPPSVSHGFRYLFTIVDKYTRYPEAIPIVDTTAVSCARALLDWVSKFGMCSTITSDRSRKFVSDTWTELWRLLGVEHTTTLAYMPQQNGLVERMHKQLKASLCAVLKNEENWDTALPIMLLGMTASYKPDIACFSAELVFGEKLRLPTSLRTILCGSAPLAHYRDITYSD